MPCVIIREIYKKIHAVKKDPEIPIRRTPAPRMPMQAAITPREPILSVR